VAITNMGAEVLSLRRLTRQPVNVVEGTVDAAFFNVDRHEARRPLVVTGSRTHDPRNAALLAQLAVLLGEEDLGLNFNWIGTADKESLARLKAAEVQVFDAQTNEERASRLAGGWLYLASIGAPGFPVYLAEAMAVGLPCVAWDTPYHRDIIRNGYSGFLCNSEAELVTCIARLVDSPELRLQVGEAARAEAARRFDPTAFSDSVYSIYQMSMKQG
jgi:glycosyltransferase involved in cell wall biosynthesis